MSRYDRHFGFYRTGNSAIRSADPKTVPQKNQTRMTCTVLDVEPNKLPIIGADFLGAVGANAPRGKIGEFIIYRGYIFLILIMSGLVYVILKNLESQVISVFVISIIFPNLSDLEIGETRAIFKRLTLLCTELMTIQFHF